MISALVTALLLGETLAQTPAGKDLNVVKLQKRIANTEENRRRIAAREAGKSLWKRQSGEEAFTNGAPLDGIYLGTVELGSNKQPFLLQFDTGSADLWVYGPDANTTRHPKFNTGASTTFRGSNTPWSVTYGDGDTTSGVVVQDTLSIGGFDIPSSGFSLAAFTTTRLEAQEEDGLIGLGFSVLANNKQTTFMENLLANRGTSGLSNNFYSLFLERDYTIANRVLSSEGTSEVTDTTGGELCIGCTDPQHYAGGFTWAPVTSDYYWATDCAGLTYKDQVIAGTSMKTLIDSGSSIISLPPRVIEAYARGIGASIQSAGIGSSAYILVLPCRDLAVMKFGFSIEGQIYDVAPLDLYVGNDGDQCGIVLAATDAEDADGQPLAIVGDTFMKNWYTIFSYNSTNSHSIGFARAVQPKSGTLDGSSLDGTAGTRDVSGGSVTNGTGEAPPPSGGNNGGSNGGSNGGNGGGNGGNSAAEKVKVGIVALVALAGWALL